MTLYVVPLVRASCLYSRLGDPLLYFSGAIRYLRLRWTCAMHTIDSVFITTPFLRWIKSRHPLHLLLTLIRTHELVYNYLSCAVFVSQRGRHLIVKTATGTTTWLEESTRTMISVLSPRPDEHRAHSRTRPGKPSQAQYSYFFRPRISGRLALEFFHKRVHIYLPNVIES